MICFPFGGNVILISCSMALSKPPCRYCPAPPDAACLPAPHAPSAGTNRRMTSTSPSSSLVPVT